MIGLGNFNHGFRTHSSIFYLSSLFNLPYSNFFLLHLSPVFFIGFANIILYNKISLYIEGKKPSYILYLSLLSFVFINVFFVRLGEHGTDRSAMILIIIIIIELLYLTNKIKIIDKNLFLKLFIFITLIVSLKTFLLNPLDHARLLSPRRRAHFASIWCSRLGAALRVQTPSFFFL